MYSHIRLWLLCFLFLAANGSSYLIFRITKVSVDFAKGNAVSVPTSKQPRDVYRTLANDKHCGECQDRIEDYSHYEKFGAQLSWILNKRNLICKVRGRTINTLTITSNWFSLLLLTVLQPCHAKAEVIPLDAAKLKLSLKKMGQLIPSIKLREIFQTDYLVPVCKLEQVNQLLNTLVR